MNKKFYITTTLPYVNADPHIGFALEVIQADTIARFQRQAGCQVIYNTGTDEHGLKIFQKACEQKKDPQSYCNEYAQKFNNLKSAFNLSYTHFIRTTDKHHIQAAQEFWRLCDKNGDIYKKNYEIRYCVGCELEKTDSELVDGYCSLHPGKKLEMIKEENYFFRFSAYQDKLLKLFKDNPHFVVPDFRLKEIIAFVKKGLEDFSVSRLKSKMPWGIDVPGDPNHVMYVWFDALINYVSTLGWPNDKQRFADFWGTHHNPNAIQIAGKDNLRQQSAMWQAMLMSAGLPNSKKIFIHGFITANGQKMSKSLGNVVDPFALVDRFGTDAVRYYLLREIPTFTDGNYSEKRFIEIYNADLANDLGNLVARLEKLCVTNNIIIPIDNKKLEIPHQLIQNGFLIHLNNYEFCLALEELWKEIKIINFEINKEKPWEKPIAVEETIKNWVGRLRNISYALKPFLPDTAEKILRAFQGSTTVSPLFPRIS